MESKIATLAPKVEKEITKEEGFKILSIEDNIKRYTPELSDNDIKAFVWYNQTLGIPMTGWEKWFLKGTSDNSVKAKEDVEYLNQQFLPIGTFQRNDTIGKLTRFTHEYKGINYAVCRKVDGQLIIVDKSKIETSIVSNISNEQLYPLVKSFSLYYINGDFVPLHVYSNTDYEIIKSQLEKDKDFIIKEFGQDVFDNANKLFIRNQMRVDAPKFEDRFKLNPFSEICRETKAGVITDKEDIDEDEGEIEKSSVTDAFIDYISSLKNSDFHLVSKDEFRRIIIYEYKERFDKDDQEGKEKYKSVVANAQLESVRLFSEFCTNVLDAETKFSLNRQINITYNRSILINTSKIPVGFICSNKFKSENFRLKKVQVDAFKFAVSRNNWCLALTVGFGKCQPLSSNILSPKGYVKMGELKVGDEVIGKNGSPTIISAIFPQGKVQCYKVTFSDGSSAEVGADHLWNVQSFYEREKRSKRFGQWKTLETKDLINNLYNCSGEYRYSIPMVDPVEFKESIVPVDPYLLGVLLGDGYLGKDRIGFSNVEDDILERIRTLLPKDVYLKGSSRKQDWRISSDKGTKNQLIGKLRELGLCGTLSNTKFVPEIYKINSSKVRIEVLRGLLDTDGYITTTNKNNNKRGNTLIYTTVSKQLCEDIVFLVQSFGGTCIVNKKIPTYTHNGDKKTGQLAYNITIRMPNSVCPVSSVKQLKKFQPKTKYQPVRFIQSIEDIGFQESQCIKVEAKDELYVCQDFIVTHNTSVAVCILSYLISSGTIKKPLIIVPKPVLKNWEKEISGYWYDSATKKISLKEIKGYSKMYGILSDCGIDLINIKNLDKKNRGLSTVIAKKTTTITLCTYEALEKMYIGDIDVRNFVINEWKSILTGERKETARQWSGKMMDLEGKLNEVDKDAEVDIQALGFDSMFVDEAHRLKNMFVGVTADKTNRVSSSFKGSSSSRALRGFYISMYLQKINGRIGFLTATPFSNTPLEVYTMLCFLGYNELAKNNISKITKFVELFFNETVEPKVNKDNRIVYESVMKNYKNKGILNVLLSNTFLYKDDPTEAVLTRPCIVRYPNNDFKLMLKMSEAQKMQRDLLIGNSESLQIALNSENPDIRKYAEELSYKYRMNMADKKSKSLAGSLVASSKISALSPFAGSPVSLEFVTQERWSELYYQSPKIRFTVDCIKNMMEYHKGREESGSSFLIYTEVGLNILPYFKEALEQICGFKRRVSVKEDEDDDKEIFDEVEIIEGSSNSDKEANRRDRVQSLFNIGKVKVIIGTSTIKEGLNLQENCATLFILTPSWNSTDINQVEGRIHRQGNRFGYARVITPVVARSMDSFIYQKYYEKKSRLADIWENDGKSDTEDLNIEIKADKQRELILDNAQEIARIRGNMLARQKTNVLNKAKEDYESIKSAVSKSGEFNELSNFHLNKTAEMLTCANENLEIIKELHDLISKDISSGREIKSSLKASLKRLENLVFYYNELIESIEKANSSKLAVDVVNILSRSYQIRTYYITNNYDDTLDIKEYLVSNGIKRDRFENLFVDDIFKKIGVYTKLNSNDPAFDRSLKRMKELYGASFMADKLLQAEGLSMTSTIEDLNAIIERYKVAVDSIQSDIEANFTEPEGNKDGIIIPKLEYLERLTAEAQKELDEENKYAQQSDELGDIFSNKTNPQLTYLKNDVDLSKCDIKYTECCDTNGKREVSKLEDVTGEVVEKTNIAKSKLSLTVKLDKLKSIIPYSQYSVMKSNVTEFKDSIDMLSDIMEIMPREREQDGFGFNNMIVMLHYFVGSTDIFVLEKDKDSPIIFNYTILNGDTQMSELGDASLEEILSVKGMNLDLHFKPTTLKKALLPYGIEKDYGAMDYEYLGKYSDLKNKVNVIIEKYYGKDESIDADNKDNTLPKEIAEDKLQQSDKVLNSRLKILKKMYDKAPTIKLKTRIKIIEKMLTQIN